MSVPCPDLGKGTAGGGAWLPVTAGKLAILARFVSTIFAASWSISSWSSRFSCFTAAEPVEKRYRQTGIWDQKPAALLLEELIVSLSISTIS